MTWPWSRPVRDVPAYIDTPAGILSAGGVRYHTTKALLDDYAAPVFERVPFKTLLVWAEAWQVSPPAVAGLVLLMLLVVATWPIALVAALLTYGAWAVASPGMATPTGASALRWLGHPVVQGLLFIGVLSALAASGRMAETWTGIAGFVALRLGVIQAAVRPLLAPLFARLYPLPIPDQTLRSVIFRTAVKRGVQLDGMAEIESKVRSFWNR
ncbi:MAG: hypothetical protein AAF170_07355 [Bacteroidota bacterium]